MPELTLTQWLLGVLGAIAMGLSKAGFNGTSLLHVLIFAFIFGARASSGIVLPMLIAADIFAVRAFRQHTQWRHIRRMLPPTIVGILVGFALMGRVDELTFRRILGTIILGLALLQVARLYRPGWFGHVPHSTAFAWGMGFVAGVATMLANAAGPIFSIYALSVALPKFELVGTGAWFFFIVNVLKVPLSAALGLIDRSTLLLNLTFVPAVFVGIGIGRWLTARVPQHLFDGLLLVSAALAATRLIGLW